MSLSGHVRDSREIDLLAAPGPTGVPASAGGRRSGVFQIPIENDLVVEVVDAPAVAVPAAAPAPVPPAPARARRPTIPPQATVSPPPAAAGLPRFPLFSDLPPAILQALIERIGRMRFPAGEIVIRQGEVGDSLYVIAEGQVGVSAQQDGREIPVARLGEGAFFGEIALLTDFPRAATVRALTECELLVITRETVAALVAQWPPALQVLLRFVRERLVQNIGRTSPMLAPLPEAQRLALCSRFRFLDVSPGSVVIQQGTASSGFFLLLAGRMQVVEERRGPRRLLAELGPGDAFGEMSLLTRQPAVATVGAVTKCFVLYLSAPEFEQLVASHPHVSAYVGDLAARRAEGNARALGATPPPARLY